MLDRGVIEPCQSSCASPVVLVTKKDGSTRFCVDYRKVNEVTRKYAYPLPRIDDTLDALRGSQYFSTLDLYSGYWQVKMDPADIDKTAFITRQGLFRFTIMPFGLCNAPATFERLLELVLYGLNWKICLIYLDDVIVYGGNFYDSLDRLKIVWQRNREANLKLQPSKFCLMRDRVPFLGHYVSREGVEVHHMKTAAVQDWPTPRTVKDIRAFLGLASYYRRYIPNFTSVATPLTDLTKKDVELIWDDNCEHAFQALKKALEQPPVSAYPTRGGHFVLSTDASDTRMGAVLEQEQEEGGRVVKRVIAYASKRLNASQRRYCTTNKELLAVVTAIEVFKYYLTSRHFTVVTNHASFTWLRNFKEPEGVVARWITWLQPFDFKIVHRPGKHHSHADGLSRRTSRPCKRDTCPECAPLLHQVTGEEEGTVRAIRPQEQYVEHFDGYLEPIEDDSALFRDLMDREPPLAIAPELLWYLGRHPDGKDEPTPETGKAPSPAEAKQAISRAGLIKQLIDVDSRQACTQTESDDFLKRQPSKSLEPEVELADVGEDLPFPGSLDNSSDRDTDSSGAEYFVRGTDESKQASPVLQALMDLSVVEFAEEQEQDPNLRLVVDMIRNSPERPSWEHVRAESAEVKAL